jgi:hypothetical protein
MITQFDIFEGYKDNINKKINMLSISDKFISGMYYIFLTEMYIWQIDKKINYLSLVRVIDSSHIGSGYISITLIDIISNENIPFDPSQHKYYLIKDIKDIIYSSSSEKNTKIEFERLIRFVEPYNEWEIIKSAEEFNL